MKAQGRKIAVFFLAFACMMLGMLGPVQAQSWKFVMISDTHDSDMLRTKTGVTPYLAPIISYIVAERPDFVLQTGDLVTGEQTQPLSPVYKQYATQYTNYQQVAAPLARANIPLYVIRGNHDFGLHNKDQDLARAYLEHAAHTMPQNGPLDAKGLSYSFIHKNIKFIMLDQFVNAAAGVVTLPLDWLKEELARRPAGQQVFVMGHSPVFSPDSTASSHEAQFNLYDQASLQNQFWQMLVAQQVTAYVSGHEHLYFRGQANGIPQIVIGNLGGPMINYNPATVDSRLTKVAPTTPVPSTAARPGYVVFTVDEGARSITATAYWLDQNNNKYVYETYSVTP